MFDKRKLVCIVLSLTIFSNIQAQISFGGTPRFNNEKSSNPQSIVSLQKIDNDVYFDEDINLKGKGSAMRVGVMQETNISNKTHGTTEILENGDRIWRVTIESKGATFMFPCFKTFDIPAGAELFVYDASQEFVIGKFTMESTLPGGEFYTQSLPGERITLEYYEPAEVAGMGTIEINEVGHGYKDMFTMMEEEKGPHGHADGTCHINVVCEEGDAWRDQIRSVVHYQTVAGGGVYMCSGALVNNTANDKTNYILSAYHCQDLPVDITRFVVYFNYQTSACIGNSGTHNNSVIGADIVAKFSASDFMLMKLRTAIPDRYEVFYAGWTRSTGTPSIGAGIHHPGGDWKKISIPNRVQSSDANLWAVQWIPGDNNKGVTEQGSSGSPLFDGNGRICGQLYAGSSACDVLDQPSYLYDVYGKLSRSWTGGNSEARRLSDWLDPIGTGVTYIDGINWDYSPDSSVGINHAVNINNMNVYPNPSNGVFNIDINEMGTAQCTIYDMMGRQVYSSQIMLTSTSYQLNAEVLKEGTYILEIIANGKKYNKTVIVR